MRKILFIVALITFISTSFTSIPSLAFASEEGIKIIVNGKTIETKSPPRIINGRLMVSYRTITSIFGVEPALYSKENVLKFRRGYTELKFKIGGNAFVNGKEIELDAPAQLINGEYYIPLRFIVESFGSSLEWDESNQTAKVTTDTDESQEKTFIMDSKTDIYSSNHLGIKTHIPKGSTIVAPPYSDHALAYLKKPSQGEPVALLQILVFPEASKTFGSRKAEDVMLTYLKSVENKEREMSIYYEGVINILDKKEIDFLGSKAREITFEFKTDPDSEPHTISKEQRILKFITVGLTRGDVFYQVFLSASEEDFDLFSPAYHDAVKYFEITLLPITKGSEIIPQQVDITPLTELKVGNISTIVPVAKSDKFRAGVAFDKPIIKINNDDPRLEYKEWAVLGYKVEDELININMKLYNTSNEARKHFDHDIKYSQNEYSNELFASFGWENEDCVKEHYTFGGEGDNRYFYSFIKQSRNDPEGGSTRTESYKSTVWIQKHNLVIEMYEYNHKPISSKNEVIKVLADLLSALGN